ncbi:MAG: hypothetical protein DMF84_11515 [Acidobacteria bacterium]|nr:MAG: hypothetical protein DMF84_11515 [Acidobacteriota bacterium]
MGTNLWVQYTVGTTVPFNMCVVGVMVDAHVAGRPGSALHADGFWSAMAQRQVPVDFPGPWVTLGAHAFWLFGIPLPILIPAGLTQSTAIVGAYRSPAEECADLGFDYYWNGGQCVFTPGSPIIIDTSGNGYHLTSVEDGVLFDLDGDGQAERVSWTRPGADNAFLAFDRNGNGKIDDGTELFGSYTPAYPTGDRQITAPNGFEALRFAESPSYGATTVADGIIDARDGVFSRLLLWTDRNHNGISEADELQHLFDAGIVAIRTDYKSSKRVDRFGNEFRQVGRLTWANGENTNVYDVWLNFGR